MLAHGILSRWFQGEIRRSVFEPLLLDVGPTFLLGKLYNHPWISGVKKTIQTSNHEVSKGRIKWAWDRGYEEPSNSAISNSIDRIRFGDRLCVNTSTNIRHICVRLRS